MQTDYAQILPIILPVPKAGPSAPANVASAGGKTTSPSRAEAANLEALESEEGTGDLSQSLSAFDQALAQMMMVQAPVAQTLPQAPAQQGLGTNPIDITAALDALQPGSGLGLAPILQVQPSVTQDAQANATADTSPIAPSVFTPTQATVDRPSQASILQAMGNATADATARVTGMSVPQPVSIPNQSPLTAPEPDQAQTAQATLQAAAQAMSSAQTGVRETAQFNSRVTIPTLASSETTSTSATSVASPLTAIAIAANGGANSADTGGAFQEAPSDFADTATAQTMPMEGEASTDIFGAPLPVEGRVTQASLQAGSSATLSTPATAPHLAAEISRKFEGKSAQFDISLTPEGLGKVDVKITINARGEVSAAMKFDNPQAAAELKGRAAELQRALEQSGFSLSQEGISFSDGQGQGFNAPQQQASQQDWQETARRTAQNRMFQDSNDLADAAALRVAEASSAYNRRSNTGVDVRI